MRINSWTLPPSYEEFKRQRDEERTIRCPHSDCGVVIDNEEGRYVSYYGEEPHEGYCPECDRPIVVNEKVERTYTTSIPEGYAAQDDE